MYPHQYTSQSSAPQGYTSGLSTSSQSSQYQSASQPQGYTYTSSSGAPQTYSTSLPNYGYQSTNPLSYTSTSYQPYTSSYTSQVPSYNYTQTAKPTTYESVTKSSTDSIPKESHINSSYGSYGSTTLGGSIHYGEPKVSSYTPYPSSYTSSYIPTTGSYTSTTSYLQTQSTPQPTQTPQINITQTQQEVVAKSTPLTTHTMHEKEVLKTPKKHERVSISELTLDYEYPRKSVESGRVSVGRLSAAVSAAVTPRASMLEPYRKSMYPEFDLVEDLPDRTFLIGSINDNLRKSHTKESLLTMPTRVSILRNSTYSPAKIEVEYLLKEKYEDGSIYEGEGKRGLRHGNGIIYYPDGTIYEGEFIGGKMSGSGKLIYPNGQICYQGEYDNDKFEGQGVLFNETPVELAGAFDYRDFSHLGNSWRKYEGKFKDDMKNGVGTLHLLNGERFYGEFENDRIHGKGTFYLMDGSTVTGVWEDNKLKESF